MLRRSNSGVRIPIRKAIDRDMDQLTENIKNISDDLAMDAKPTECDEELNQWRETALRLKAEMQNFHKRQQRWAQDEVQRKQNQLLLGFVEIVDDLEKVISHLDIETVTHQGVKIAYDNMLKLLTQQGVERIEARNLAFDPMWHEAVAMVPGSALQSEPMLVKEVIRPGYRIGDRLLRPSQVVVGKRSLPSQ